MIDLHMHSSYSADAEFTPSVLAKMCAEQGVTLMAVTDHNSARANTEAREAAKERGIAYLSGIEIDCLFEDTALQCWDTGLTRGMQGSGSWRNSSTGRAGRLPGKCWTKPWNWASA